MHVQRLLELRGGGGGMVYWVYGARIAGFGGVEVERRAGKAAFGGVVVYGLQSLGGVASDKAPDSGGMDVRWEC